MKTELWWLSQTPEGKAYTDILFHAVVWILDDKGLDKPLTHIKTDSSLAC